MKITASPNEIRSYPLALVADYEKERRPFPGYAEAGTMLHISKNLVLKYINLMLDENIISARNSGTRDRFYRISK